MRSLSKTSLSVTQRVHCAANLIACQDQHGHLSQLSRHYAVSRTTLYKTKAEVSQLLTAHFTSPETTPAGSTYSSRQLERAVVALRVVSPNSLRHIRTLIPLLYPGAYLSYGTIHAIVAKAETHAQAWNEQPALDAIKALALDELFSQGHPVLAGVDLDRGFLGLLSVEESRNGATWAKVLAVLKKHGCVPDIVVKDAADGIAAGVTAVFPDAQQRDDVFHILYKINRLGFSIEKRAYGAIIAEDKQIRYLNTLPKHPKKRRKNAAKKRRHMKRECTKQVDRFDEFQQAKKALVQALDYFDEQTQQRLTPERVQADVEQAAHCLETLNYPHSKALATYLRNRIEGVLFSVQALEDAYQPLVANTSEEAVTYAVQCLKYLQHLHDKKRRVWEKKAVACALQQTRQALCALTPDWATLLTQVAHCLTHRYRASSAIEGFNAALRPYLTVHKRATSGFLPLFQAYYNLRLRQWGRHQGTSAYECVTGEAVSDWLTCLGFPPDDEECPQTTLH